MVEYAISDIKDAALFLALSEKIRCHMTRKPWVLGLLHAIQLNQMGSILWLK